jgi:hypothetical protein
MANRISISIDARQYPTSRGTCIRLTARSCEDESRVNPEIVDEAKLNGNAGGQILPDLFTFDVTGTPRESMAAARQW